jgi:hypothetical protein
MLGNGVSEIGISFIDLVELGFDFGRNKVDIRSGRGWLEGGGGGWGGRISCPGFFTGADYSSEEKEKKGETD